MTVLYPDSLSLASSVRHIYGVILGVYITFLISSVETDQALDYFESGEGSVDLLISLHGTNLIVVELVSRGGPARIDVFCRQFQQQCMT